MMKHLLHKTIAQLQPISDEEWAFLERRITAKSLKKGELLFKEGQVCQMLAFVVKGVLRNYLIHDGKELTLFFAFENELAIPYEFCMQMPSQTSLQTLTKTEVLLVSYDDLQSFYALSANTQKVGRLLMEDLYCKAMTRRKTLLSLRPQEYYSHIEEQEPKLIHRIQSQHLASYMGITRESLSRIKKRRSKSA